MRVWLVGLLALLLAACGGSNPHVSYLGAEDTVLAFGDSLTYGTGAEAGEAYPAQLQQIIGRTVVNAGVPGETTAEGLARLPEALAEYRPHLLLLCLGGNDMLRHLDPAATVGNLRAMLLLARQHQVEAVLIGVPAPRLLGGTPEFYADIAREFDVPYEGKVFNEVLKTPGLKSDPIHANAAGYRVVAERLAGLLKSAGAI